jgi:prevent-host-death family protein
MRDVKSDEARRDWRDILDEVQADPEAAVRVSRHGRPVAVVVSAAWYERVIMNGEKSDA